MRKEMMQKIEAELKQWPGIEGRFEKRAPHPRLHLTFGKRTRFVVIPGSPSDKRGLLNKIRDIRFACAQLGARRQGGE
jgi:hypothetical protein